MPAAGRGASGGPLAGRSLHRQAAGGLRPRIPVSASAIQRRAVVTGAGSGIGLAVAQRLRREGARVLAVDIDERGLLDAEGFGCEIMAVDVADPAQRERLAAAAEG